MVRDSLRVDRHAHRRRLVHGTAAAEREHGQRRVIAQRHRAAEERLAQVGGQDLPDETGRYSENAPGLMRTFPRALLCADMANSWKASDRALIARVRIFAS